MKVSNVLALLIILILASCTVRVPINKMMSNKAKQTEGVIKGTNTTKVYNFGDTTFVSFGIMEPNGKYDGYITKIDDIEYFLDPRDWEFLSEITALNRYMYSITDTSKAFFDFRNQANSLVKTFKYGDSIFIKNSINRGGVNYLIASINKEECLLNVKDWVTQCEFQFLNVTDFDLSGNNALIDLYWSRLMSYAIRNSYNTLPSLSDIHFRNVYYAFVKEKQADGSTKIKFQGKLNQIKELIFYAKNGYECL